jgi:hypothetical protein
MEKNIESSTKTTEWSSIEDNLSCNYNDNLDKKCQDYWNYKS